MKESFKPKGKRAEKGMSFLQLQESVSHVLATSAQMVWQVPQTHPKRNFLWPNISLLPTSKNK